MLNAWETEIYAPFLAGPPGREFVTWGTDWSRTVFAYNSWDAAERQAYRDEVRAVGNTIVLTFVEAEFGNDIPRARLLAREVREDGFLAVTWLGDETTSFESLMAWLPRIIPAVDGPNVILQPLWEPPDSDDWRPLEVTWPDQFCDVPPCDETFQFNWRNDDALIEQLYGELAHVALQVADAVSRRISPIGGHSRPAWWSAGSGLREVDGDDYELGHMDDRDWLRAMVRSVRDVAPDGEFWWFQQEHVQDTLWRSDVPCGGDGDESEGIGAFFWAFGYCGSAPSEPGHCSRVGNTGARFVMFEWTRDPDQAVEGLAWLPELVAAESACSENYRGVMW